ncbi:hypothetical protein C8F04DRAFT_1334732 [Mycena alexandri]|uniref:Uncharacterized protein n=1 Tax=Mycena alexandri TaxID=1745969 RepID=A0AAD6TI81_9AGAR|nr:hypothetical protein C8F04DRAFT_1334732 [Mycena alexandri]
MSSPSPSVYITRLQAIPPSLFFMVPVATIVLFFLAISHTVVQHRHEPVFIHIQLLDRRNQRVAWAFPVVFSLALLAIVAGALLFLRGRSNAFSLVVADTIVTSFLYVELSLSVMYLLSIVADMGSVQPILFVVYCITLAAFLISATLVSVLSTFKPMPPLLAPILYLAMSVLTMPVITFSFLSTVSPEATLAPQITLASTCSYPTYASEKPGILDDVPSSLEMSHTGLPANNNTTRNIPVYLLCGQISAVIHFAFTIGICILLPDQSSPPPSTLTIEEVVAGVWAEALVFRIVQTAFLVFWIICTMSAFLQLFSRVNRRPPVRSSTLTAASDATAFTAIPSRSHRPNSKSRSSSFSSPRPRRQPIGSREIPRRPSPPGEDFQNLHDPFASARTSRTAVPQSPTALTAEGRPTRMSAWGTLPTPIIPPRPPPNVLVINPPARRLPSLRNLRLASRVSAVPSVDSFVHVGSPGAGSGAASLARSKSFFSYTTPSAYSQEDGFDDTTFDAEEALLAQQLLRRLDAAGGAAGGWGSSLKQLARNGSTSSRRRL